MTNLTIWQLSELLRAGWAVQIIPAPPSDGRLSTQALVQFVRERAGVRDMDGENMVFPITDWINLSSFEIQFGEVVEEFYQQVFPLTDAGTALNA